MLALAAAIVLSQVVYSWVDDKGVTHYTDGASGLPEEAEKTELPPVSVVERAPENLPKPEPLPEPKPVTAAPAPAPAQRAHTTHNPLPGFEYVEHPAGMEGTGLYRRFDPYPYPIAPCYGQPNVPCRWVQQPLVQPLPQKQPAAPKPAAVQEPTLPKPRKGGKAMVNVR